MKRASAWVLLTGMMMAGMASFPVNHPYSRILVYQKPSAIHYQTH